MTNSFPLPADTIHIWAVPLTVQPDTLAEYAALLSPDERQRVNRYAHADPRQQFTVARATLRLLLSRYLRLDPREVRFSTADHGKPALPDRQLYFNVSHSKGLALHAFTRHSEIGVDVEQVREFPNYLEMAARFFTPGETTALRSLPPQNRQDAFFHIWTRKEAFLKAIGLGLSHGLERFEVSVPPDDPARILHIDGDRAAGAKWSLLALTPTPGYVGSLAVQGATPVVELRQWEDLR